MRSHLFDHIMVWIYNSEISCQMDIRMNIPYTALWLCILRDQRIAWIDSHIFNIFSYGLMANNRQASL